MYERITNKSLELFSLYGIKNVNMHFIAAELGISKKTLYEKFCSKEALVSASIELFFKQIWKQLECVKQKSLSHIETILQINTILNHCESSLCPAFCKDIRYFDGINRYIAEMEQKIEELYLELFNKGVSEGIFIEGEDYTMLASLYSSLFKIEKKEYRETLIHTLLRGVCTTQGIQKLDVYRSSGNYNLHCSI